MKFDNQLRYAATVISAYKGGIPLHVWLKDFFRAHKQMGSRDRKLLSSLVFSYYRLGHAWDPAPPGTAPPKSASPETGSPETGSPEEKILLAFFLCRNSPHELLAYFRPSWNEQVSLPVKDKIALCRRQSVPGHGLCPDPGRIFPWPEELTAGVDPDEYGLSFLQQPDLFLRIRPGHEQAVLHILDKQEAGFEFIPPATVRLPNGTKTEAWFTPDKEIVIQDYSSQRTAPFLAITPSPAAPNQAGSPSVRPIAASVQTAASPRRPAVWDACAASGGKSLLAWDLDPSIELTVSDTRKSILHNLRDRFKVAGIKNYRSFIADLSLPASANLMQDARIPVGGYDLVIADVPCSGSGTWGRTPEELYFFDKSRIRTYRELQRKILLNLLPAVSRDGHFVYITCSVFREENEGQVGFITANSALRLEKMDWLKGYDRHADTLFIARFGF